MLYEWLLQPTRGRGVDLPGPEPGQSLIGIVERFDAHAAVRRHRNAEPLRVQYRRAENEGEPRRLTNETPQHVLPQRVGRKLPIEEPVGSVGETGHLAAINQHLVTLGLARRL